eukprot:3759858-Rhodomonas_salina.1
MSLPHFSISSVAQVPLTAHVHAHAVAVADPVADAGYVSLTLRGRVRAGAGEGVAHPPQPHQERLGEALLPARRRHRHDGTDPPTKTP